jgi:hypothetical protein
MYLPGTAFAVNVHPDVHGGHDERVGRARGEAPQEVPLNRRRIVEVAGLEVEIDGREGDREIRDQVHRAPRGRVDAADVPHSQVVLTVSLRTTLNGRSRVTTRKSGSVVLSGTTWTSVAFSQPRPMRSMRDPARPRMPRAGRVPAQWSVKDEPPEPPALNWSTSSAASNTVPSSCTGAHTSWIRSTKEQARP